MIFFIGCVVSILIYQMCYTINTGDENDLVNLQGDWDEVINCPTTYYIYDFDSHYSSYLQWLSLCGVAL